METRKIVILSIGGLLIALVTAFVLGLQTKPEPPVFTPASNPYNSGIYANGIIETLQASGENVNVFPEVGGTVIEILPKEGQSVVKGEPLIKLDATVQSAITAQQKAQMDAAEAQIAVAEANLQSVSAQFAKDRAAYKMDPRSISRDLLDTASNSVGSARASLIASQKAFEAAKKSYEAGLALLNKFTLYAPDDLAVLAINAAVGSYISSQGVYDTYSQQMIPVATLGQYNNVLAVRCYIDEVLINRLKQNPTLEAVMYIRGTSSRIPLKFVRIQPFLGPKIELSNNRNERVDVRVLPVIFSFEKPRDAAIYPGQLVDVYINDSKKSNAQ